MVVACCRASKAKHKVFRLRGKPPACKKGDPDEMMLIPLHPPTQPPNFLEPRAQAEPFIWMFLLRTAARPGLYGTAAKDNNIDS